MKRREFLKNLLVTPALVTVKNMGKQPEAKQPEAKQPEPFGDQYKHVEVMSGSSFAYTPGMAYAASAAWSPPTMEIKNWWGHE